MTNPHQATPDDWAQQEDWANRSVFSDSSCILELRDRIEALEACATLAQPKPVAPTDEQTFELADDLGIIRGHGGDLHVSLLDLTPFAELVLTRYSTPAIQPVPVSERLPEPDDLNGEGWCWWFDGLNWMLDEPENWYTHWLPHHALPTPEATNA